MIRIGWIILLQIKRLLKEFEKCANEHINNQDVRAKLYRPGLGKEVFIGTLKDIIEPVYTSASNMGFEYWKYTNKNIK